MNKGLPHTRIAEITGIPLNTLNNWKKEKNTYRSKLYKWIKTSDESFLIEKFKDLKQIQILKQTKSLK